MAKLKKETPHDTPDISLIGLEGSQMEKTTLLDAYLSGPGY